MLFRKPGGYLFVRAVQQYMKAKKVISYRSESLRNPFCKQGSDYIIKFVSGLIF